MASPTNVHALRRPPTPEEKLRRDGPEALTDAELLALELAHLPQGEALEVARQALDQAGGLRRLLDLPHEVRDEPSRRRRARARGTRRGARDWPPIHRDVGRAR